MHYWGIILSIPVIFHVPCHVEIQRLEIQNGHAMHTDILEVSEVSIITRAAFPQISSS
jgi:hypothetical protein